VTAASALLGTVGQRKAAGVAGGQLVIRRRRRRLRHDRVQAVVRLWTSGLVCRQQLRALWTRGH